MTASNAIEFRSEPEPAVAPAAVPVAAPVAVEYDNPAHKKWTPPMRLLKLPTQRESIVDRFGWPLIAVVVASLYLYALLCFWAPAHPGTDQNGYFVGAREFAHTLSSGLKPTSDYAFVGHMWVTPDSSQNINYPKYPLGLQIIYASFLWIFGEGRGVVYAHLVSPVCAALATLGVFAITRRIAGGFVGVMAMLMLACGQVMFTLADNPNSHASCICAVVWGMFFLIRWLETGALWRGMLAGLLFGIAYTIRYTEGLLLLPMGVAMIYAASWQRPTRRTLLFGLAPMAAVLTIMGLVGYFAGEWIVAHQPWLSPLRPKPNFVGNSASGFSGVFAWLVSRPAWLLDSPYRVLIAALSCATIVALFIRPANLWRLLLVGGAWLLPVAYLTLFNMVAMHSFTSYASTNESTGFAWSYFYVNWEKMVRVMNDQGLFFIAPIGVLGLVCMYRRLPLLATLLTLWFVPGVLLYTAYYWAPDNMGVAYSRFILTQVPALVIPAAWLMGDIARRGRHGAVGRIAIGLVVFTACSLGVYRTVLGSEWGQRLNIRANFEVAARQNMNLAGLGDELRRAVNGTREDRAKRTVKDDSDVILFADGERINHLQWIGGWQTFSIDAFNFERSRGYYRQAEENDPDPIDASRMKFLQTAYKGKDQRSLQADENTLIANALDSGKRVYYVLTDNSAKQFGRQIDRRQFDVKDVGSFNDVPSPRVADDFLTPAERDKQPVNRFGRGNAFLGPNFLGNEKLFYRIGQVVKKPATTMPATKPATAPTTKP